MIDWFRSWHGAPTDNKWLLIAHKAGVAPGIVSAVVWALLDHASQNEDRGSVKDFDAETYAVFSGFTEENINSVLAALKEKKLIENDRLKSWERRQPVREDENAAERKRKQREKSKANENVTQCHTQSQNVTTDKIREEKKDTPQPPKGEDEGFKILWGSWTPFEMGKGNKQPAEQQYRKIIKTGVPRETILKAAKAYCAECKAKKIKTQHVVTWLRQAGWESVDEPPDKQGWEWLEVSDKEHGPHIYLMGGKKYRKVPKQQGGMG